ncbi:hypothetical protein ACJRO7_030468 [Eucalyptus globulus]|uniref:Uncharacterized protein n=1 Tax=Eucalyptus globulus TaxID=34317 RepID=A0ABD3JBQ1_EUCGL
MSLRRNPSDFSLYLRVAAFNPARRRPIYRLGGGGGQLEQEAETVVRVLQPGPLEIIKHKFSTEEINEANATLRRAVEAWRRSTELENRNPFLREI